MKKHYMYSMLVIAVALFGASRADAQPMAPEQFGTPDNLPPPMEDVCDMTSGAAHGLCIAYCEAMDCDSDNPNANAEACAEVGEKFFNSTDELPPCERACPCWDENDLNSVTAENHADSNSCPGVSIPDLIQNNVFDPGVNGGFAADPTGVLEGAPTCFKRDLPPFSLIVTAEEAQVCADQIFDRCAAIGSPY